MNWNRKSQQNTEYKTHRGRWSASRVGCGGRWPHRWCSEPQDWAPSSRKCLSLPYAGWRCATCALYAAGRPRGHAGHCGNSFSTVTCLGDKEGETKTTKHEEAGGRRPGNMQGTWHVSNWRVKGWPKRTDMTKSSTHWLWTCRWTFHPLELLSVRPSSYSLSLTLKVLTQILKHWWQPIFLTSQHY